MMKCFSSSSHQVYALWFKQILHELEKLKSSFQEGERGKALHTLKRIRSILKVLVSQVDVLETITPLGFFRFGNGFNPPADSSPVSSGSWNLHLV